MCLCVCVRVFVFFVGGWGGGDVEERVKLKSMLHGLTDQGTL